MSRSGIGRDLILDSVERGPDLGENQPVGRALVDVRRVPVEDRAIFIDEGFDVAGELGAVTVHFDLLDFTHVLVSIDRRG